jgi:hypothetical protein
LINITITIIRILIHLVVAEYWWVFVVDDVIGMMEEASVVSVEAVTMIRCG